MFCLRNRLESTNHFNKENACASVSASNVAMGPVYENGSFERPPVPDPCPKSGNNHEYYYVDENSDNVICHTSYSYQNDIHRRAANNIARDEHDEMPPPYME